MYALKFLRVNKRLFTLRYDGFCGYLKRFVLWSLLKCVCPQIVIGLSCVKPLWGEKDAHLYDNKQGSM